MASAVSGLLDGPAIWARVNEVDSVIRTHAEDAVRARRLSAPVVEAMRWAGVFRMAMPAAWGGPQLDVCTQTEVIERLARADASAAWCAMIGLESGFFAAYLDESAARELYPELDMITAGFSGPAGSSRSVRMATASRAGGRSAAASLTQTSSWAGRRSSRTGNCDAPRRVVRKLGSRYCRPGTGK